MDRSWASHVLKDNVSLEVIIKMSWGMSFLPFIWMLATAIPRFGHMHKVLSVLEADADSLIGRDKLNDREWKTLFGDDFCTGRMLFSFPDGIGMSAIASIAVEYQIHLIKKHQKGNDPKMFKYLHHSLLRCVNRVLMHGLLENVFQLHVQLSLWGVRRAEEKLNDHNSKLDEFVFCQLVFVVVVNSALSVSRLGDAFQHTKVAYDILDSPDPLSDTDVLSTLTQDYVDGFKNDKAKAKLWMYVLLFGLPVYTFFLALAVCKASAFFLCEHSVWNLSGCVDVSSLARHR